MKKIIIITTAILFCILTLLFIGCDESPKVPGGSDDASLSDLVLSSGTLTPEFASATTEYSVTLESGTTSITITPTAANQESAIKVDGTPTTSGTASAAVSLSEGLNTVVVEVTSADGSTVKKYTLKITIGTPTEVKVSGTLTINQIIPDGETYVGKNFFVGIIADFESEPTAMYEGVWGDENTQEYELSNVPPGTYYLYAIIDWNDDGYDDGYPDFAGLYNYDFDELESLIGGGEVPGPANLTVADVDIIADITDIQQIPAPVDGTITVNIENAAAREGELFGFAVFEDDNIIPAGQVAAGFDTITALGTAESIAFIYPLDPEPMTYNATGGDVFDIHVMIDMNGNGITDLGDYVGTIEDVYVNGDTTATVDYITEMFVYLPPDQGIGVSLTMGEAVAGDMLVFAVYDNTVNPEDMASDNYLASGAFQIAGNGTGSSIAIDNASEPFIGEDGTDYNILVFIDNVTVNYDLDPDEPNSVFPITTTIEGPAILDIIYEDLLSPPIE